MNRYPLWKYVLVAVAVLFGLVYTLPNFFGESPAVQVSSAKATLKIDAQTRDRVASTLQAAGIENSGIFLDSNGVKVRLLSTDSQLHAKEVIEKQFNPDASDPQYVIALNLLSSSPQWLTSLHALPMYLGLDLRGGVHFLLQVDMPGALTKRLDSIGADLRSLLRDKNVRHSGITREGERVLIRFRDTEARNKGRLAIEDNLPDLLLADQGEGDDLKLVATLKPAAIKRIQEFAIKQNITTLNNRINELGVAEPVIAQQGADRIVVQLPGVQDTAKAKDILGRTATLEIRMVDETPGAVEAALAGQIPFGSELYVERGGRPLLVKKQVVLTGDRLTDAQPGFDNQTNEAAVHLTLDSPGARIFKDITRDNVGKRMAIVLIEKGKGEVVTAPVIRAEIGGGRVQISGRMSTTEANDTALLLRAGSLAAPMEIIEERTIGPSLGAENITKGFHSTMWGFTAIAAFMIAYYMLFGLVSVIALACNLLFLVALLSLLQATLTLPGIAAIALTLGMAIDANVLINERIREELRNGSTPQAAIHTGYERAFGTILDSNITTLIAGIALLIFGSGPVRGFAVVHCLGIMTSLFSAVVVSRALINLIYGRRRKVESLAIGQIWKPAADTGTAAVK
ncbi:MAG TPA: protein translocase subunit SecD [Candidatus Accumulibacter sp.]|uniref:protein translocase subunit SecD n=1 Tax=Accumulibacter sp. TaxID=2053492 RepID=UPI000EDEFFEE|nr:protein translocase subunit SecD [Accumulibacter sp.]HCZ13622.1 protein translocase subunit SecD [Accumulibacter sp.]HRD93675.1 protein translocase subunit SecD [Accumulibacter sp.]